MQISPGYDTKSGCPRPVSREVVFRVMVILALFLILPAGLQAADPGADRTMGIIRTPAGQTTPGPSQQGQPTVGKGDLYALVVGVANYKIPKLNLKVSDNDARQFAKFLETQRQVFKNTHVKTLVNQEATKVEIEKQVYHELSKAGKNDTVVLFLSGHGAGDPKSGGDYFFLGYDADPEFLEATAVKMSGTNLLKNVDAPRVLVVADSCHAGVIGARTKATEKNIDEFARLFSDSAGRAFLSSSKAEERSQEKPGLNNSVFTYYLLKGLNGEADANRDGIVTVQEAYEYVYEQTKNETQGAQRPQLAINSQVGPFPVSVLGKVPPMTLEVSFIAQDPRCTNKLCTDPPDDRTVCNDPLCKDVELKDGDTMYSGQNYQIGVRPFSTSYVYVYQIGTNGDLYRLFPDSEYISPENKIANPLKGGEIYWMPGKDAWLRLDDQQGKERIYVVASRSRNQILEDLYGHLEKLRNQGSPSAATRTAQKSLEDYIEGPLMGVTKAIFRKADNTSNDPKIRTFEELRGFFESPTLDAVRSVSFEHRSR